jgi:hypothetical protein
MGNAEPRTADAHSQGRDTPVLVQIRSGEALHNYYRNLKFFAGKHECIDRSDIVHVLEELEGGNRHSNYRTHSTIAVDMANEQLQSLFDLRIVGWNNVVGTKFKGFSNPVVGELRWQRAFEFQSYSYVLDATVASSSAAAAGISSYWVVNCSPNSDILSLLSGYGSSAEGPSRNHVSASSSSSSSNTEIHLNTAVNTQEAGYRGFVFVVLMAIFTSEGRKITSNDLIRQIRLVDDRFAETEVRHGRPTGGISRFSSLRWFRR